jgi:hypothetical protein
MPANPARIHRKRTKGWRMPVGAIHVGRPGRWSNPWTIEATGSAEVAVATFRAALVANPENIVRLRHELAGMDLACWCPLDQPCHADVLLELANARAPISA